MEFKKNKIYYVNEPWFSLIKDEIKTIEGRLNRRDYSQFKKGDIIIWVNDLEFIKTKIVSLRHYKTFEDYLMTEGLEKTLPGIKTIEDGVNIYYNYYNKSDEDKYGVLAIELNNI